MTGIGFAAILLLLLGTFLDVPVAIVLAIVILPLEIAHAMWARHGLRGVSYRRKLERDRVGWGEEVPVAIEVWNQKRLPLAWLRADDEVGDRISVRERRLTDTERTGPVLRNVWTLGPFERVTRRFHLVADRRGLHEIGPASLSVGDLFAREAATEIVEPVDRFLVRPRVVPAGTLRRSDTWGGAARAVAALAEDPSRFAGVREYSPGDPLRRVHPRASARLGRPLVKVFEPSRDREVLLVLDVEQPDRAAWESGLGGDEAEELFVIAASLARTLAEERAAFGIVAAGYHGAESRIASLPVTEAPGQLERVLDLLARLSSHPSAPFAALLGRIVRTTRPGTTILVISARDMTAYAGHLRRLERGGCRIVVVACGTAGPRAAQRARRAGIASQVAVLDAPWRTATHLAVTR